MQLQRMAATLTIAGVVTAGLFVAPAFAQQGGGGGGGGGGGCQRGGMNQSNMSTGLLSANSSLNSTGFQSPQQNYAQQMLYNGQLQLQQAMMQQQMAQSYSQQRQLEQAYEAEQKAEESERADARARWKVEKQQRAEAAKARRIARANKAAGTTNTTKFAAMK